MPKSAGQQLEKIKLRWPNLVNGQLRIKPSLIVMQQPSKAAIFASDKTGASVRRGGF